MERNSILLATKMLKVSTQNFENIEEKKIILKGVNFKLSQGEIQIIMGPNGSGKSTFAKIFAGHPSYKFFHGSAWLNSQVLMNCLPETRSRLGLFLGFQYPIEISGVSNQDFMKLAYHLRYNQKEPGEFYSSRFLKRLLKYVKILEMTPSFLPRSLNRGFSGGEKKKNEILQMAILDSNIGILDEIDSGLDVDALKILAKTLLLSQIDSHLLNFHLLSKKSLILITHYQRLVDYICPDLVQIMKDGRIVCNGTSEIGLLLDQKGYDWLAKSSLGLNLEHQFNTQKIYLNSLI